MKTIRVKLENIKESLENRLEGREFTYDNRSEKWQESEKGQIFMEKNDELQGCIYNIEMAIDNIDTFTE